MIIQSEANLALIPEGSKSLGAVLVDIGEARIQTMAMQAPSGEVIIGVRAVLPDGGWCRARIECDPRTYNKTIAIAERIGGMPVLAGLIERHTGHQVEFRKMLPR